MKKVFNSTMRPAFSMILAIIFIVVIATLGMLSLQLSAQSAKQTEHVFLREQADLFAMNAAELAVLTMQQNPYVGTNQGNWIRNIEICYPVACIPQNNQWLLKATVQINYMAFRNLNGVIPALNNANNHAANIKAKKADVTNDNIAMLNITVESNPTLIQDKIRIFRSTIQRP